MATRSSITILTEGINGDYYKGIYCHLDGYPEHNGALLLECYNTLEKVQELISHGDMSSLAERIEPEAGTKHSFDNPQDGVCVYYHRDRGENWEYVQPFEKNSQEEYYKGNCQEYNYLFKDGKWYWNSWGEEFWRDNKPTWKELTREDCHM